MVGLVGGGSVINKPTPSCFLVPKLSVNCMGFRYSALIEEEINWVLLFAVVKLLGACYVILKSLTAASKYIRNKTHKHQQS